MMEGVQMEELWRSYHSRLLAFIASKGGSPEDAEDLLQEVFLRLYARVCCMPTAELVEKLIYRIARNLIIDRYRRRRRTEGLSDDIAAPYGSPEIGEDPYAALARSLRGTVEELPEPYRGALLATEYEGLTQADLAEREGISLSGAKSRVQRARAKLKALLLECCSFELDVLGRIIDYRERCCRALAAGLRSAAPHRTDSARNF